MQALVQSGGFVAIPQDLRERMGIEPGDRVHFALQPDGHLEVRKIETADPQGPAPLDPNRFEKLRGTLKSDLTTDQIMVMLRGEPD